MSKYSHAFKKWFSLLGLVPIGVYIVVHLYKNLSVLQGPEAFNQMLNEARSAPMIVPIMILLVWIPIFFHGLYGLVAMKQSKPNVLRFKYLNNLKYLLQRISGIGLLLFIPVHLFNSKINPHFIQGHPADYQHMHEGLSNPLTTTVYLLGILGVAYHLANGVWQASIGWGITVTERSMHRMQIVSYVIFAVVLTMGYAALWGVIR